MHRSVFALAAALALAWGAAARADDRLPADTVPLHYDLAMHPDAEKLAFTAEVRIDVQVAKATPAIVLNAADLAFDEVKLEDGRAATVTLDPKLERARFAFAGGVKPGRHRLSIRYHGKIRSGTFGFFAVDYSGPDGPRRTLATNFEPAGERQMVPSWDEPGRKATFSVTVDTPKDRIAIGNMPVAETTPLPGGGQRVRFAVTPKMSTYLLFFTIGDYERISKKVAGVDLGVVMPRGMIARGQYALEEGARLLPYYNTYFGTAFPLPKLDLIAAPTPIEGGAMENWGANFYGVRALVFDPATSNERDRQRVFQVVAHEVSHQWFGDLVTMGWWDNLWLNEGFARWMQTKAADDLHPEWKTGLQAADIVEVGMAADAALGTHPVEQPIESAQAATYAFDNITYDKGATVIGMMEAFVGPERFRNGVRRYMREHAYGNTVSADLWRAMQAAGASAALPVANDFTHRSGLPLVTVKSETAEDGQVRLALAQDVYRLGAGPKAGDAPFHLPFAVAPVGGKAQTVMLAAATAEIDVAGPAPVLVNAGRKAYARVKYDPVVFDAIAARMGELPAADQVALMQDAWALTLTDAAPAGNLLSLIDRVPANADPLVWLAAGDLMLTVDRMLAGSPTRPAYRAWARGRLAPVFAKVGWRAMAGETPGAALLRDPLLTNLARFGDPQVQAEARRLAADPAVTGGLALTARRIVAASASDAEFAGVLSAMDRATDPLARSQAIGVATAVSDEAQAARVLDVVAGQGSEGNLVSALGALAYDHPALVRRFLMAQAQNPTALTDRSRIAQSLTQTQAASWDWDAITDLQIVQPKLPPEAAKPVAGTISTIEVHVASRGHAAAEIAGWLDRRGVR